MASINLQKMFGIVLGCGAKCANRISRLSCRLGTVQRPSLVKLVQARLAVVDRMCVCRTLWSG